MAKIITSHDYPPIPDRRFDWRAYRDGCEEYGQYGYGATKQDAIQDLLETEQWAGELKAADDTHNDWRDEPDDSTYRRDMIDAGRGHLLR